MNKIVYITTLDAFLEWWPFLLEGLSVLNSPTGGRGNLSQKQFFNTLLRVALGSPAEGAVCLVTSKNSKPLAFVVLISNTAPFDFRTAVCYALYSNNKAANAVPELHKEVLRWCREHSFERLYAYSRRISGAAVRLFEKKWGFRKDCLVFVKDV